MKHRTMLSVLSAGVIGVSGAAAMGQADAEVDVRVQPQGAQAQQQAAAGQEAQTKTIRGTVIDLEAYLIHGEATAKMSQDPRARLQATDPVGLLADDGKVYLILDRQEISGQREGLASAQGQWGQQDQASQQDQAAQQDSATQAWQREHEERVAIDRESDAEVRIGEAQEDDLSARIESEDDDLSARVESEDDAMADLRESDADAELVYTETERDVEAGVTADAERQDELELAEMDREESDIQAQGEVRSDIFGIERGQAQRQGQQDMTFQGIPQQGAQNIMNLSAGQQVTLSGQVFQRGDLQGIAVSGFSVEQGQQGQQQQGQQGQQRQPAGGASY